MGLQVGPGAHQVQLTTLIQKFSARAPDVCWRRRLGHPHCCSRQPHGPRPSATVALLVWLAQCARWRIWANEAVLNPFHPRRAQDLGMHAQAPEQAMPRCFTSVAGGRGRDRTCAALAVNLAHFAFDAKRLGNRRRSLIPLALALQTTWDPSWRPRVSWGKLFRFTTRISTACAHRTVSSCLFNTSSGSLDATPPLQHPKRPMPFCLCRASVFLL